MTMIMHTNLSLEVFSLSEKNRHLPVHRSLHMSIPKGESEHQ
jgi:hypothetical protein